MKKLITILTFISSISLSAGGESPLAQPLIAPHSQEAQLQQQYALKKKMEAAAQVLKAKPLNVAAAAQRAQKPQVAESGCSAWWKSFLACITPDQSDEDTGFEAAGNVG